MPHVDDCAGCLPRPADDDLAVCRWHARRMEDAVAGLITLVPHLREIGKPYAQSVAPNDDTFSRGDPAEHVNIPAAWMAADELTNELLGWVRATLEESPRALSWPDRKPWKGDVTRWALDHMRDMLALPFAGTMVSELVELIATTRHRWPTADDVAPVEPLAMPCPRCEHKSLIRRPPRYAGDPRRIECNSPDCARIYTEDEYDRLVAIALRDGKMGKWKTGEGA